MSQSSATAALQHQPWGNAGKKEYLPSSSHQQQQQQQPSDCSHSPGSVQFSRSVVSDSLRPMNCSTPGLPVHHQLPEFTQTHVHRVGDAIQPSQPLLAPSPPAPNPSQHQGLSNESTLRMRWPKYWSFSFSIIPSKEVLEWTRWISL